jgi:hypothetical protein
MDEQKAAAGQNLKYHWRKLRSRRDCEKHAQGMFFVLASLGSLALLAPKSAAADLSSEEWRGNAARACPVDMRERRTPERSEGGSVHRSDYAHTKTAPQGGRFGMAEPEGFEPSIGLYNPITV